jgi:hypothetical protein
MGDDEPVTGVVIAVLILTADFILLDVINHLFLVHISYYQHFMKGESISIQIKFCLPLNLN